MGVQDDPVRVREEASPSVNSCKPVSDGNVEAFADTGDLAKGVVSLDVAV